ncbi:hypothetical protein [Streptomyces sp. A012304]|uniref:hypothetical protein n=1 Tax=Streptomyces sp. A012304 TaxID=375446 RepID=UPI00222E223C|nr:hypothetical protein [Streptomyces sp. A012304]
MPPVSQQLPRRPNPDRPAPVVPAVRPGPSRTGGATRTTRTTGTVPHRPYDL